MSHTPSRSSSQKTIDFGRIARAIEYIEQNFKQQPELEQIAAHVGLRPSHFQRLFTEWAGTSPKRFLQFISIEYAKGLLQQEKNSLMKVSARNGLSGPSRLHDLFIKIEGMTPGEYKNGGQALIINYTFETTIFGQALIASTKKGICFLAFADDKESSFQELVDRFPNAQLKKQSDALQRQALALFSRNEKNLSQIKLHLKGTPFQLKVWNALLQIPEGRLSTYGFIAHVIKHPKASRAVGTAVGDNPVSFLIPCHRIIQSTGVLGRYHWGKTRKTAMIGWEGTKNNASLDR